MAINTIPFSRLETDLRKTLNDCAESGQTLVVELPDQRLLAIQPLDAKEDSEQALALILRAKWMRVMGASEDEISECCDPAFYSPDLDEELDNILALREISHSPRPPRPLQAAPFGDR